MEKYKKDMMRAGISGVLAFVLGVTFSWLVWGDTTPSKSPVKTYENVELSIRFSYPDSYFLIEYMNATSSQNLHQQLLLSPDGALSGAMQNNTTTTTVLNLKESAKVIAIDILGRGEEVDIADWVRTNATTSYFAFSDKKLESASVGNKKIVSYNWSGESDANTLALIHNGRVFLLSVVYESPSNDIRNDFISFLSTMEFI